MVAYLHSLVKSCFTAGELHKLTTSEMFKLLLTSTSLLSTMGKKNTTYRLCVPLRKQIAIALWKLATGSKYRTISHLFGVGIATCFSLKFPDAAKLVEMATLFHHRWRVPQCVGALEGSDIPIIAPEYTHGITTTAKDGIQFYFGISVLDFLGVFMTQGSKTKLTSLAVMLDITSLVTLSYPLQNWLMKPILGTTADQEGARSVVEMSFGRLKGRWRCLLKRNDCKLELSKKMVLTCCVLHNICEEHGDNFTEDLPAMHVNMQPPLQALPEHGHLERADVRAA
uniref:DDE Tnp4 domain-containing protein n=1 Tax=Paramormyrops kingsleyae TaxID=1676925 RepID=A0A3B3T6L5_9TELE